MDIELEQQKQMDRVKDMIGNVTLKKLDTNKKGLLKGFKMAAVPGKLLNAMRHPWKTFNSVMDKIFNYDEEAEKNLEEVKNIKAELDETIGTEQEFTPTLVTNETELEVTNEPVAIAEEPTLTPEVTVEEPVLTNPIIAEATPLLTPEVKEEVKSNDGLELTSDENVKYLNDRKKELEDKLKSLKLNKDFSKIDEIIDLEDMLEEVNRQLDNIDVEISRQINEEFKKRDLKDIEVEEKIDLKDSIFSTMANFLTNIVEDKKVENMEIDEQLAILMARKEKNINIIASYEPYIKPNLFSGKLSDKRDEKVEAELNNEMAEIYGDKHLEKARVIGQINQIKTELRNTDFDSANDLRVQLKKLEGRLDGLNSDKGYSKTK